MGAGPVAFPCGRASCPVRALRLPALLCVKREHDLGGASLHSLATWGADRGLTGLERG